MSRILVLCIVLTSCMLYVPKTTAYAIKPTFQVQRDSPIHSIPRGGSKKVIEEESDEEEDESESEYDSESEEEEEALLKSTVASTAKRQKKQINKSKSTMSAVLLKKKKKSILPKIRLPYLLRACLNPITLFSMTRSYFASLINISYLEEVRLFILPTLDQN